MASQEKAPISYTSPVGNAAEEKAPFSYTTTVTSTEELENGDSTAPAYGHAHWQPGFFSQFPWLGIGALLGVLACLTASVVVLVCANGQTQTRTVNHRPWPKAVAPNVLVSIFNSVANICFGVAISNGVAIAWWRRALKGGTIKDLNQSWQFSSSVKEVFLAGRAFNIIALTALVAKMTIIDSTLLQKSIGTYTQADLIGIKESVVYGYINETFPSTGMGDATNSAGSGLQTWFNRDLEIWSLGGGVYPNQFSVYTEPEGRKKNKITKKEKDAPLMYNSTSYLNISGAGFAIDCLDPVTLLINASDLIRPTVTNSSTLSRQLLFDIQFSVSHGIAGTVPDGPNAWVNNTDYINMEMSWSSAQNIKDETGASVCPGTLTTRTCRLRPAVVVYPLSLKQRGPEAEWVATLGVGSGAWDFYDFNEKEQQQNYFYIDRILNNTVDFPYSAMSSGGTSDGNDTLSGIAIGLQTYLGGYSYISKDDTYSFYNLNTSGTSQSYLANLPNSGDCNFNYSNPFLGGEDLLGDYSLDSSPKSRFVDPGLIGKINSIIFGVAADISASDPNNDYNEAYWWDAEIWVDTIHYVSNFWYMGGAVASTIICILCVLPSYWGFWQLGRKVTLGPFEIAAAFRAPNLYHPTAANAPVNELLEHVGERRVQFGHIVSGEDAGRIGVAEPEIVERVNPRINVAGEEMREKVKETFARK